MRALVTGGSGFVGSHVVDALCESGIAVRVFDVVEPSFRSDIDFYKGDVRDLEAVRIASADVDVIFHLAAIADVNEALKQPLYCESVNVRGTINVLEAARTSRIRRVVYASTTWVYSDVPDQFVDERTPLRAPSHLYTATKIASEFYCESYKRLYGIPVTILRYGTPYGPRARDGAVVPTFVQSALRCEPMIVAGDGSQYRKFVYVEDLAKGNVLALNRIAEGKIYNLEGAERITIRQIAEIIGKYVSNSSVRYVPPRSGDFSGKEISSRLAKEELSWQPRVTFEKGVRRCIDWYQSRFTDVKAPHG